ncbi:uncharacterized protein VTP21DRAFT_7552 [Calcarisporiella thermophila]|uniref:uncharacterized protein n=1 Tax=Calcarisporiella thermophila TaxID=911321 RepID=UPI003744837B
MDTYPLEYIAHLLPLVLVTGLIGSDITSASEVNPSAHASAAAASDPAPRRRSSASNTTLTRHQMGRALVSLLTAKNQAKIWEPAAKQGQKNWLRAAHVDKSYRFPPKKSHPSPSNPSVAHSPLSPNTPESPLYPDGIMTPLWIRKHRDQVPSIMIAFYDLWDWSMEKNPSELQKLEPTVQGPLGLADPIEREKDAELAAEISEKRKYAQEYGCKFAAVLILMQPHLDDPNIEERVAYIRRSCGLDSRYSFFLLPPGTQTDMQEFVNNLQNVLYENAMNYYREHGKRVRKKRSRLPSLSSQLDSNGLPSNSLSLQGWMLRYDIKSAVFSEFRQDYESAIKHLESAYAILLGMFTSTPDQPSLQPGTKRWAEARLLADVINFKICKFYLYIDAPTVALFTLNKHLNGLRALPNAWTLSGDSFDYWSWLSRQYRLFGDLLELTERAGYKLPVPLPQTSSNVASLPITNDGRFSIGYGGSGGAGIGVNPALVIQHAGFYYQVAAICNEERKKRFFELESNSEFMKSLDNATLNLFTEERNIHHQRLTIDLLSKSYDTFKRHNCTRMTLYLAAEIGNAYFESKEYDKAAQFFERIAKSYRKEKWYTILASILHLSVKCARELGRWGHAVELLVELLSEKFLVSEEERANIQNEIIDILRERECGSQSPQAHLHLDTTTFNSFITCQALFEDSIARLGESARFQITLTVDAASPPALLRFGEIRVIFNEDEEVIWKDSGESTSKGQRVQWIDCARWGGEGENGKNESGVVADLGVEKGMVKVLEGIVMPKHGQHLKIHEAILTLPGQHFSLHLHFPLDISSPSAVPPVNSRHRWLTMATGKPSWRFVDEINPILRVQRREPRVSIHVQHISPALLGEWYPLDIEVRNAEEYAIQGDFEVEVRTIEVEECRDAVALEPTLELTPGEEKSRLEGVEMEALAGETLVKRVFVRAQTGEFPRVLEVKARYWPKDSQQDDNAVSEATRTERIAFVTGLEPSFEMVAQLPSLQQIEQAEGGMGLRTENVLLWARVLNRGPWPVEVKKVELRLKEQKGKDPSGVNAELISMVGMESEREDDVKIWKPNGVFGWSYLLKVRQEATTSPTPRVSIGPIAIIWRRRRSEDSTARDDSGFSTSFIELPEWELPPPALTMLTSTPAHAQVGVPFSLRCTLNNPTPQLHELSITVEGSEAFVFSGYKQRQMRIMPFSTQSIWLTCYPLVPGRVRLPRVVAVTKRGGEEKEVPGIGPLVDVQVPLPAGSDAEKGERVQTASWPMIFVMPRKAH